MNRVVAADRWSLPTFALGDLGDPALDATLRLRPIHWSTELAGALRSTPLPTFCQSISYFMVFYEVPTFPPNPSSSPPKCAFSKSDHILPPQSFVCSPVARRS